MIRQSKLKQELKGPSLTIKWAFASSFFIFVVFTIFAVITYKTSTNLIVAKERTRVELMMSEISSRLADSEKSLDTEAAYRLLTKNLEEPVDEGYDLETEHSSYLTDDMMEVDTFLSVLGRDAMNLFVYNEKEKLMLRTHHDRFDLYQKTRQDPTIITVGSETGFLAIQPIFSKVTRERVGYAQVFYELSSFYEMRSKLLITLIVLEVVSLILSSILGYFLSTYFLKPLKVLRDTMNTIRKDPQSDAYMPTIDTNDELTDLAEIFNDMLERMRLYMDQQKQFVEDVSHELRTPVAIMEGHLSMLQRWGKNDPEILDEALTASQQEISRMKSLVQEMLDLSRAEQVDIHYGNETTNAQAVVHQVYNNFKMLYPEFNFILEDDLIDETTLQIYRNHFEQIIIIILDNAVKYSTDRKEIRIHIEKYPDEFEISIQDFGEGISDEDLQKVFNRFYRVDKARARTKGGNGLGLAIAKQLVDSYKGRLDVESQIGEGTIFRIFIPLATSLIEE